MSDQSVIEFECHSCLHRISVPAAYSGKQIECPQCFAPLTVPSHSLDLALFDDIFESLGGGEGNAETRPDAKTDPPTEQKSDAPQSQKSDSRKSDSGKSDSGKSKSDSNQSLDVDGIETSGTEQVFGFNCHICETRLHVQPAQVGSEVKCPTCFTKLRVPPPKKVVTPDLLWGKSDTANQPKFKSPVFNTDEMKLSDPIDRPPISYPNDPSFGLEPVTDDLLTPLPTSLPPADGDRTSENDSEIPMLELLDDERAQGPSRRQRFESAQQRKIELDRPGGRWKGRAKEGGDAAGAPGGTFKPKKKSGQSPGTDAKFDEPETDLPTSAPESFDFTTLTKSVSVMFRSPGLMWRAIVSALLMGIGWAIMHAITANYHAVHKDSAAQIGEWAISLIVWFLFGGIPYLIGTLWLWFICGYVYRESAHGKVQVPGWATGGSSEISSTFLIFAFGYFIAGLPLAFVSFLIVPFRFLFAPPLLLSAWFNQSPFAIIAVDAFRNVQRDWHQWKSYYLYLLALAGVALVAGLLMMIPIFILSAITSLMGAAMLVSVTIAFAAVTGWQCSLVMKRLEE